MRRIVAVLMGTLFLLGTAFAEMPVANDSLLEAVPMATEEPIVQSTMEAPEDMYINQRPAEEARGQYSMESAEDEPFQSVHVRAVGDLMLHQRQLEVALMEDGTYDFHDMYSYVSKALSSADLTIGNLETTINTANTVYTGYPMFNSPVSILDTLRDAGFDFLTLANNHMLDSKFDGMCSTVTAVEEAGFVHAGAFRTKEEAEEPVIMEVNGIKIGFLSYTEMTNGMEKYSSSSAKQFGVSYLKSYDIAEQVRKLRENGADTVIAMPHWGIEYKRYPNATQKAWARRMILAGVDVVIGSHPHVVQPIEWMTVEENGENHTGLVAWSLGNFVSNMSNQYTDSGIILDFTIIRGLDGSILITDVGYVPIYVWKTTSTIRAVCSGKYLMEQPEGMSDASWSRLRTSWSEMIAHLGTSFNVLNE